MPDRRYQILLVEDSPFEIRLFQEASRTWKRPVCLHIARDAPEALDFLEQPDRPRLDLIITNINLPKMSGLAVHHSSLWFGETASEICGDYALDGLADGRSGHITPNRQLAGRIPFY